MEYVNLALICLTAVIGAKIVISLDNSIAKIRAQLDTLMIKVTGDGLIRSSSHFRDYNSGLEFRVDTLWESVGDLRTLNSELIDLFFANISPDLKSDIELVLYTDFKGFEFKGGLYVSGNKIKLQFVNSENPGDIREMALTNVTFRANELKRLREELCPTKCSTKKPRK